MLEGTFFSSITSGSLGFYTTLSLGADMDLGGFKVADFGRDSFSFILMTGFGAIFFAYSVSFRGF